MDSINGSSASPHPQTRKLKHEVFKKVLCRVTTEHIHKKHKQHKNSDPDPNDGIFSGKVLQPITIESRITQSPAVPFWGARQRSGGLLTSNAGKKLNMNESNKGSWSTHFSRESSLNFQEIFLWQMFLRVLFWFPINLSEAITFVFPEHFQKI